MTVIPESFEIDWIHSRENRMQGKAEVLPFLKVPVMLIKHTDSPFHWCGYLEYPDNRIPFPEERVEADSYTRPTPTFYGPSGPIIAWLLPNADGELTVRNPELDSYWVGFDLQANPGATAEEAERILKQFVQTFYTGYFAT